MTNVLWRGEIAAAEIILPPKLDHRLKTQWNHRKTQAPAEQIDLSRAEMIRDADKDNLADPNWLEMTLLPSLGLNAEELDEFPSFLYPHMGSGLLHWQYPKQFSKYLAHLSGEKVESYLEIGVRHGGTFVITVEYLQRFHPVKKAVGVDIRRCPGLVEYGKLNPRARFTVADSQSAGFQTLLDAEGPFDLVLIDGDHSREGCWNDFELLKDRARILVFHDIDSVPVPGVGAVWRQVKAEYADRFDFYEYADQYDEVLKRLGGPVLGIGVAIRK